MLVYYILKYFLVFEPCAHGAVQPEVGLQGGQREKAQGRGYQGKHCAQHT